MFFLRLGFPSPQSPRLEPLYKPETLHLKLIAIGQRKLIVPYPKAQNGPKASHSMVFKPKNLNI